MINAGKPEKALALTNDGVTKDGTPFITVLWMESGHIETTVIDMLPIQV
jgi:hypothetical protein